MVSCKVGCTAAGLSAPGARSRSFARRPAPAPVTLPGPNATGVAGFLTTTLSDVLGRSGTAPPSGGNCAHPLKPHSTNRCHTHALNTHALLTRRPFGTAPPSEGSCGPSCPTWRTACWCSTGGRGEGLCYVYYGACTQAVGCGMAVRNAARHVGQQGPRGDGCMSSRPSSALLFSRVNMSVERLCV